MIRRLLAVAGIALVVSLGGCTPDGRGDNGNGNGNGSEQQVRDAIKRDLRAGRQSGDRDTGDVGRAMSDYMRRREEEDDE